MPDQTVLVTGGAGLLGSHLCVDNLQTGSRADIAAPMGTRADTVHLSLPVDDPQRRRPDIGHAQALLGWSPRVSLDDGLRATADWFARESTAPPRPMRMAALAATR